MASIGSRARSRALALVPALVLVAGFVMGGATPAYAATTVVNCLGFDLLSAAITAAAPGDTLVINGTCPGHFLIEQNLTLQGATGATLDGGGSGGSTLAIDVPNTKVKVTGMTITGGGTSGLGGGIFNGGGTLTVSNSTLSGNYAGEGGGGIFNSDSGTLTVSNSTLSGNSAPFGGGIENKGTLKLSNSTLNGNSALLGDGWGGGIYSPSGTATLTNSTLSGNFANIGGGIFSDGTLTVANSTFSGNSALDGGGILNEGPGPDLVTATVTNSTFSGNSATGTADPFLQEGGAIDSGNSTLTVTSSTFSGNTAVGPGADIDTYYFGSATFMGTILSSSGGLSICASATPDSTITDGGYNISSDASCGFSGTSLPSIDPLLVPLASNGGHTKTMALVPASPAVDAGGPSCPAKDQRGTVRPQGSACDIGAYELKAPWIAAVTVDAGQSGGTPSVWGTITCNQGASFAVSVTLTQGNKKALGTSAPGACNGSMPVFWVATVGPGTFASGAAKVAYTASAGTTTKKGKVSTVLGLCPPPGIRRCVSG